MRPFNGGPEEERTAYALHLTWRQPLPAPFRGAEAPHHCVNTFVY